MQWRNFVDMWESAKFGPALFNSLYVSIVSTLLALLVSIPFTLLFFAPGALFCEIRQDSF